MDQKTEVFLFGAGAVLDWGGPKTTELTQLVRKSGFKLRNSDTYITEHVYQSLLEKGYEPDEVNFETIINVIEELAIYFSEFNSANNSPSILRAFIEQNDLQEILNYSIKGGVRKHGYALEIPEGKTYNYVRKSYEKENPDQFFLYHLLSELITDINAKVSKYAYQTPSHSVIDKESEVSKLFRNWMKIKNRAAISRLYTLNYDRIFKNILAEENIDCFEGFNISTDYNQNMSLRADIPRLLTDIKSNIHYNLHGSVFWEVLARDKHSLPNPEIVFSGTPRLPVNNDIATLRIEKGKPVFVSNIISGYQKAQKSMISPYKQMQAAFDRDCCLADTIYILGYSFGDEHINESIKTALRHNTNLNIEIVDPNFQKKGFDISVFMRIFSYGSGDMQTTTISKNEHIFFNGKVKVFTMTFREYLELTSTKKLLI